MRQRSAAQATSMSSITSDSIREKQDQINQAQKERETMKSNLSNLEQIKKDLETKKSNLKVTLHSWIRI